MKTEQYFREKAARCRRLARDAADDHARRDLLILAEEFDVAASALTGGQDLSVGQRQN